MIDGIVTDDGVPAIDVQVGNQRWQAIIDTGFNGELELPERLRSHVNAQFVGRATSLLAANQRIEEDVFLVDFPFDGRTVRAQATFVDGDEILIGTRHVGGLSAPDRFSREDRRHRQDLINSFCRNSAGEGAIANTVHLSHVARSRLYMSIRRWR